MTDKRTNKEILLSLEQKHQTLAEEVKEMHKGQEQIFTSIFGISGTENGGLVGTVNVAHNEIKSLQTKVAVLNDRSPSRKRQITFIGTIGAAIVGALYGLGSKLGWW